jgi:hypothetical protein
VCCWYCFVWCLVNLTTEQRFIYLFIGFLADVIVTSSGLIQIVLAGPRLGNTIAFYELSFDIYASTTSCRLKSRLELTRVLPRAPPTLLLGPLKPVATLTRILFDPTADGLALILVLSGLDQTSETRLERWEYLAVSFLSSRLLISFRPLSILCHFLYSVFFDDHLDTSLRNSLKTDPILLEFPNSPSICTTNPLQRMYGCPLPAFQLQFHVLLRALVFARR